MAALGFLNKNELDHLIYEAESTIRYDLKSIENDANSLLNSLSTILERDDIESTSKAAVDSLKDQADNIGSRLVSLKDHAEQTKQGILRRCDDHLLRSYAEQSKFSRHPWSSICGGTKVITLLSDAYLKIRSLYENKKENEDEWVPPSTFDRSTNKYWIYQDNLTEVMLKCLEEVPLLVYGKDASELTKINSEEDIWETISTSITSIYFDSPKSMVMYQDRIARVESAKLFRIRWYGNKPSNNEKIFLELKTHHERWVQHKSVKERVELYASDLSQVLSRDGLKWSPQHAATKITRANPKLDGKQLSNAVELLLRIRNLIIKKNLIPRVRSTYKRVAFQSSSNNDLRFTIDRDIELSSESGAPLGSWCRPSDLNAESVMMPVGVFEVKLGGVEAPYWVNTLLSEKKIEDGHKFSKYLSGASILFEDDVSTLPYWAEYPLFKRFYKQLHYHYGEFEPLDKSIKTASYSGSDDEDIVPVKELSKRFFPFKRKPSVALKNRTRIEPKTYFAAERTFIQWVSAAFLLVTVAALLFTLAETHNDAGSRMNGMILLFVALFLAFYALVVYFRRLHLMKNSKPYGYTDHVAPIILTIAIVAGIGSIVYHALPSQQLSIHENGGSCYRMNYSGISNLEYQPSDITIDSKRNIAIVPSNSQITAINLDLDDQEQHEVNVLSSVRYGDFEATVLVNDILFAVSEYDANEASNLFAFTYDNNSDDSSDDYSVKMKLLGSWKLSSNVRGSESIAYRKVNDKGQLLISSYDNILKLSQIHVFEEPRIYQNPVFEGEKLKPLFHLNEKLISNGLKEKKISSMQVFEDTLFVLYDNEMIIRSFDLNTGNLLNDMKLPKVGQSFDKQWEGLFLHRDQEKVGPRSNLRGSSHDSNKGEVTMYLALDSPPQIWRFTLNESIDEKKFSFPKC